MSEYHKINSLYHRDKKTNKLIDGVWSDPVHEYLKDLCWVWTRKIDGMNVRVQCDPSDGFRFDGRTNRANLPGPLYIHLHETFGPLFPVMCEKFPKGVIFYGEGHGAGIQRGGPDAHGPQRFVLFDVWVNDVWLDRSAVDGIGASLGIPTVPVVGEGTIAEAEAFVRAEHNVNMEGLVIRPKVELRDHKGNRVIAKIKRRDYT